MSFSQKAVGRLEKKPAVADMVPRSEPVRWRRSQPLRSVLLPVPPFNNAMPPGAFHDRVTGVAEGMPPPPGFPAGTVHKTPQDPIGEIEEKKRDEYAGQLTKRPELAERIQRDLAPKVSGGRPNPQTVGTVWDSIENLDTFLNSEVDGAEFLDDEKRILARQCITEIFAPRGLGKSLYALWLAVQLARLALRVLLIDRDNPRHTVRGRLLAFGANGGITNLKVISREKCPPLTNAVAWASFPYEKYDVVILDSFDSAAEGVGEQDSGKPSKAVAPLLDIARRENGPAILILGNTVKSALHSRGSGVIEDRADIVYEVRDATDFHPTGNKPWVEELPPADASSWASRASRRKQREKYRLAFVSSKFRVGQEPDPFILEIDTTIEPWVVLDVTDKVDEEGAAIRKQRAREKAETIMKAREALSAEVARRAQAGEAPMLKDRDAVPLLTALNLRQKLAREVVNNPEGMWEMRKLDGLKGHPVALYPPIKREIINGNTTTAGTASIADIEGVHFRQPHEQRATEIDPSQTRMASGPEKPLISVKDSLYTPPDGAGNKPIEDREVI